MPRTLLAIALTALLAGPAMAGGFSFDLPTLTFPDPKPTAPGKACAAPADLAQPSCKAG